MADPFGKYDVYAVAGSIYCYPDSSVLRNKLNLRDADLLCRVEADLAGARQTEIFYSPVAGRLHQRIFAGYIGSYLGMCIPLQAISGGKISQKAVLDFWPTFKSKRNFKRC